MNRVFYAHCYGMLLASGGLAFGLGVGAFTTFFPHFIKNIGHYSAEQQKSIQPFLGLFFSLGALFACVVGSFLIQALGRYLSIIVMLVVEIVALIAMAFSSLKIIYALRFVLGYCACFWTLSLPGMIFEVFPPGFAGRYAGLFGAFLTAGIGIGFCFGHAWVADYWRLVLCWPAAIEAIRLVLLLSFFRMRSPVGLAEEGKPADKITAQYRFLYDEPTAQRLTAELQHSVATARQQTKLTWAESLSRKYALQIFLAVLLNMMNQLTGINLFAFYCKDIFESHGFKKAVELSIGFTVVGVISAVVVSFIAAKVSIRKIIIWGLFAQALGHFVLISGIATELKPLIIIGPYIYSYGYSQSMGGLMYAYCSLIVPARVMPFCVFFQWALCCLTVEFAPAIRAMLQDLKMFFVCQVLTVVGTFIFIAYSVELKDVSRDQVLAKFGQKKFFS